MIQIIVSIQMTGIMMSDIPENPDWACSCVGTAVLSVAAGTAVIGTAGPGLVGPCLRSGC